MALETEVVEYAFKCDGCDSITKAKSHDPEHMPAGYHIHLRRVTFALKHLVSGALYFCCKDCLVNAMQYQISSLTQPVEED